MPFGSERTAQQAVQDGQGYHSEGLSRGHGVQSAANSSLRDHRSGAKFEANSLNR